MKQEKIAQHQPSTININNRGETTDRPIPIISAAQTNCENPPTGTSGVCMSRACCTKISATDHPRGKRTSLAWG